MNSRYRLRMVPSPRLVRQTCGPQRPIPSLLPRCQRRQPTLAEIRDHSIRPYAVAQIVKLARAWLGASCLAFYHEPRKNINAVSPNIDGVLGGVDGVVSEIESTGRFSTRTAAANIMVVNVILADAPNAA